MSTRWLAREWLYLMGGVVVGALVLPLGLRAFFPAFEMGKFYDGLLGSHDAGLAWVFALTPYFICQLVRSVIWATKTLKRKMSPTHPQGNVVSISHQPVKIKFPPRQDVFKATEAALKSIRETRFFATERGYQGRFYCALQRELDRRGLLLADWVLEMEYQKSARHNLTQRPDIVLHIPAEVSGAVPQENNAAVWALKLRASQDEARGDCLKLNDLFRVLRYSVGFFII
ncbi:MAG: hypothetical protein HY652_09520 [Acidobacteria bacterium]|nr:hypothetical protein [Acidobacteriota bacterium]